MLYFLYSSGMSLIPFVQLCARECFQFPVSEFPSAVGQQIAVHHRGIPYCSLPPVCSCISFLSFSSRLPSHLLMWPVCVRMLWRQNWVVATSSVIPAYWETTALFSSQSAAAVCVQTWFGEELVSLSSTVPLLYGEEGFSLCGCQSVW